LLTLGLICNKLNTQRGIHVIMWSTTKEIASQSKMPGNSQSANSRYALASSNTRAKRKHEMFPEYT